MTLEYRNATEALPALLQRVLMQGHTVESRNGKTKELTMQQVTLTEPDLYITTPDRRVSLPAQIAETMWILAGRNDVEWLSHYLPRAKDFSDDGKAWRGGYGPRLRDFGAGDYAEPGVDQLAHIVNLLKEDPETRRAVFTIYDPQIDNKPGKDIPCNNWVHFLPREGVLHAHVAIRSNDLFWGWSGINAFEWTALLMIVAGLTGMERGSITFSTSSLHLYERHFGRASDIVSASAGSSAYFAPSPEFRRTNASLAQLDNLVDMWFKIEALIRENNPAALKEIQSFPEPMMQSWLYVLAAWNRGDLALAGHLKGTTIFEALYSSPKRKVEAPKPTTPAFPEVIRSNRARFTVFATNLHKEKNAAYGDSWKKRGEMLGIMANIARKIDRLGVAGGGDTSADTAIDTMMYLIKYNLWLRQQAGAQDAPTEGQSHVSAVDLHLQYLERNAPVLEDVSNGGIMNQLRSDFDTLEHWVEEKRTSRGELVRRMAQDAYILATRLWAQEEWQKGNETRSWNPEQGLPTEVVNPA